MGHLPEWLLLWVEGRSGWRSLLVATVVLGGLGAWLEKLGVAGYAIAAVVLVLALPLDLLTYHLGRTRTPTSSLPENVCLPEIHEEQPLKACAAGGRR
jgi:hypothetical protein